MQVTVSPSQLTAQVAPVRMTARVGSSGDVLGPGSATDGQAALFDGPSGRRLRATATGAVGLALLARSALTAGALLLGAGAGAPTELATTSYGRSFLGLADAAAGRSLLQLGASDSPTFAGASIVTDAATSLRVQRVTNDTQALFGFTGGDWRWAATYGTTGAYADFAWYTSDTKRMALTTGGVLSITGTAPGTPGAGEVRIGGGAVWAAGNLISYGNLLCTPPASHANLVLGANDAGSYGTVTYNGNGSQQNWRVGCNITVAGAFEFIPSTAVGGATFTTPVLTIAHTGKATFVEDVGLGCGPLTGGGSARWITCNGSGSVGGGFITAVDGVATGYLYTYSGYMQVQAVAGLKLQVNSGDTALSFETNRAATFYGTTAPGTAGANEVRVGAGQINAAGDIITAGNISAGGNLVATALLYGTYLQIPSNPPASATASGAAGYIAWDANYIYVCTASNVWKRAALTTW